VKCGVSIYTAHTYAPTERSAFVCLDYIPSGAGMIIICLLVRFTNRKNWIIKAYFDFIGIYCEGEYEKASKLEVFSLEKN
jgi:hypothetical protein